MIYRIVRPLWLPLVLALFTWAYSDLVSRYDPDPTGWDQTMVSDSFSLGGWIKDLVDPWVLLFAALCAFAMGRLSGVRNALRFALGGMAVGDGSTDEDLGGMRSAGVTLAAAGRGLLWGTLLLHAYSMTGLPWGPEYFENPRAESPWPHFVLTTPLFVYVVASLYLLPLARQAQVLANGANTSTPRFATKVCRCMDKFAIAGLWAMALLLLLTEFRAGLIDATGAHTYYTLNGPSFDSIRWDLVLWGLMFIPAMIVFAGTPHWIGSKREHTWSLLADMCFAAGALAALMSLMAGIGWIARAGGQANPVEIQGCAGNSVLVFGVGFTLFLAVRVLESMVARRS